MTRIAQRTLRREARETQAALQTLEAFEHLSQLMDLDMLRRPRAFLKDFTNRCGLLNRRTGAVHRRLAEMAEDLPSQENVPERLPHIGRRVLADLGRIVAAPPEYRDPNGPMPQVSLRPHALMRWVFTHHSALAAWRIADYWQLWEMRRARQLAESRFARHRERTALIETAAWVRWHLVHHLVRAAEILASREDAALNAFLAPVSFRMLQSQPRLGKLVRNLSGPRRHRAIALWIENTVDPLELKPLAQAGAAAALVDAVRWIGVPALGWPWVQRIVGTWRRILEDEESPAKERKVAQHTLALLGTAFSFHGKGGGAKLTAEKRTDPARKQRRQTQIQVSKLVTRLLKRIDKERRFADPERYSLEQVADQVLADFFGNSSLPETARRTVIARVRKKLSRTPR